MLPYLEGLARSGVRIQLHSFEQSPPPPGLAQRLAAGSIDWRPHSFGRAGAAGGLGRLVRGALALQNPVHEPAGMAALRRPIEEWWRHPRRAASMVVHARSDLAAASAILALARRWVWDVRSFWPDERIAMGTMACGSPEERALRRVEAAAASRSAAIITLTAAAIEVLARRHGPDVRLKATVIPTCVDTERFSFSEPERQGGPGESVRVLLNGSFNALYDLDTTLGLVAALRRRRPAELTLVRPRPAGWDTPVAVAGGRVLEASFSEMPAQVAASDVGLCIQGPGWHDSLAACAPIKVAEFLACGRPVVVNAGLGDYAELLPRRGCGVVVEGRSAPAVEAATDALCDLLDDPDMPRRCRALAEEQFSLAGGVARLAAVYRHVADTRTR